MNRASVSASVVCVIQRHCDPLYKFAPFGLVAPWLLVVLAYLGGDAIAASLNGLGPFRNGNAARNPAALGVSAAPALRATLAPRARPSALDQQ